MKKQLFPIVCLILFGMQSNAQVSTGNNNIGTYTGQYVGWDGSMSNPLVIKHIASQDIEFYTNNSQRMTLKNTGELGIGVTSPSSWLHVKSTGTKETFRTDVPNTYDNYWRMYRNGTEYGRLVNFDGGNSFNIQAPRGHLRFASGTGGTATGAMEIREQGGADAGYVTIGTYGGTFSPACRLHLHESATSTPIAFQISNNSTGFSTTDGLRISNDNSGRVTIYNWEDDDIAFGTGNAGGGGSLSERMIIVN